MKSNLLLMALLGLAACGDGKRTIADNCGDEGPCADGLCIQDRCLDPEGDDDGDGLVNRVEAGLGSDPFLTDTDGDAIADPDELGDGLAATDTDGDGLADIIESAVEDDDDDCIPNQYDAQNAVANGDLSPLVPVLCPSTGVCADSGATLAVTCSDGFASARCDFSGVPGYLAVEAGDCNTLDDNCDGQTDEDLVCAPPLPDAVDFHFLAPSFSIEATSAGGVLIPRGEYVERMVVKADSVEVGNGCLADAFIRVAMGGEGMLRTVLRCTNNESPEVVAVEVVGGAFGVDLPASEEPNDFGTIERSDAWRFEVEATAETVHPRMAELLVGQSLRTYVLNPETRTEVNGRELMVHLLIAKSEAADGATIAGAWGFAGLLIESDGESGAIEYNSGLFDAVIANPVGAGTMLTLGANTEWNTTQPITSTTGGSLQFNDIVRQTGEAVSVAIAADGRINIEGDGGGFVGATTPSGDFIALVGTVPPIHPFIATPEPVENTQPESVAFQFIAGVRLDPTPIATIAGHRYRIYRQGYSSEPARFGIVATKAEGALTFGADGGSMTSNSGETRVMAPLGAGPIEVSQATAAERVWTVKADGTGRLEMTVDGDASVRVAGFVQAGGRVLVLQGIFRGQNDVGALDMVSQGLVIAVCEDCD